MSEYTNVIEAKYGETVYGTAGNDYLSGLYSDYVFTRGGGMDVIKDKGVIKNITFPDAIASQVRYYLSNNILTIKPYPDSSDQIEIQDFSSYTILSLTYQDKKINTNQVSLTDSGKIIGTENNEIINGTPFMDSLVGLQGNDILRGGYGKDTYIFNKGDGQDTVFDGNILEESSVLHFQGGKAKNVKFERVSNDLVISAFDNETDQVMIDAYFNALDEAQSLELVFDDKAISELAPYFIDNKSITNISGSFYIYGTAVNDTLHSDNEDARIFAKAGNDILVSGNGHDELYAGSGDDMVTAGAGDDFVYGEAGSDHVYAGIGNDNVYLDEGDDIAYGNEDNDEIYGQTGKDSLYGGAGEDMLDGGIGDDELYGGTSHDNLFGAEGNDILNGEADDDYLSGNLGHDTYIFSGVFGYDVIADFGNIADKDILLFKDLKLDEVSFSLNGTNLLLTDMTREGNYVEIVDYVTNQENYIEQFTFIDYQVAILVDYKNSFDNQININLI